MYNFFEVYSVKYINYYCALNERKKPVSRIQSQCRKGFKCRIMSEKSIAVYNQFSRIHGRCQFFLLQRIEF